MMGFRAILAGAIFAAASFMAANQSNATATSVVFDDRAETINLFLNGNLTGC